MRDDGGDGGCGEGDGVVGPQGRKGEVAGQDGCGEAQREEGREAKKGRGCGRPFRALTDTEFAAAFWIIPSVTPSGPPS